MIRLSFRLLSRDWRSGELRVLLIALLIAVTCVTSVSFFTSRISQALISQSSELLGADLRLVSDHPIKVSAFNIARKDGLQTTETRSFRSMIMADGHAHLVEIKAVGKGYPLRGHLRIATDQFTQDAPTNKLPESGEVWVSSRLLQQFGLSVGERVQVGNLSVRISAVLTYEPDRSGNMFSLAPRLLMNLKDLPATDLEQEGSRISYMLLVAGDQRQVKEFQQQMKTLLERGERLEGASDARREIRTALTRAQQFLGLAAVVAVVLACVAIAMAARRFSHRHLDTCAIMRCFGARQSQLTMIFVLQLFMLGLMSGLVGVLAGYFSQTVLAKLLGGLLLVKLPQPSVLPVLIGLGVSFGGLMGFALPPILRLRNVPTMRVLNRDSAGVFNGSKPITMTSYLPGLVALAVLVLIQAGDLKLGFWLLSGLVGTALVLWVVSALLVWGLKHIARHGSSAWRFGLVNLTRRTNASIIQVMAFGVGLMVLLLLTVVRGDLLRGWAQSIPPDAPNRFVINIQPDQLTAVKAFFKRKGMETATLYPMVRGRLIKINGKPVSAGDYQDQRTKRLVDREFNLSWAEKVQKDNKIVAGHWWNKNDEGKHLFSVEAEIARAIGIKVGDTLTYNIAGQPFTAKVTSLRKVEWDSMHANFFVLASPGALNGYPQSYITSFYLPNSKARYLDEMVKSFPNLTVIDIASILAQIRLIIERVSLAVQYVFIFTLAAGLTVMYAAIQSTMDERLRENAILRALGAQRRRLWKSLAAEFVTLGSLAGLLAAFTAGVVGFALAHYVLNLDYVANNWLWVAGLLSGGIGVGFAGIVGARQVIKSPPLTVLRRG
jgi:putative ABC transport system permease protein